MKQEPTEILSAFVDGEEIDPTVLADALTSPGAREVLIDFVLLRAAAKEIEDLPGEEFYARMEALPAKPPPRSIRRWLPAAAAIVLLFAGALGMWGIRRGDGRSVEPNPPVPARTIHLEPGVDWHGQG